MFFSNTVLTKVDFGADIRKKNSLNYLLVNNYILRNKQVKTCRLSNIFYVFLQNDQSTGEVEVVGGDTLANIKDKVRSCAR